MKTNQSKKTLAKVIVKFANVVADRASGSASAWSVYQPIEPKKPTTVKK